ncbi:MAG: hypothetical protein RBU23_03445 [Candidatus Auribacterota bacterium]|jgi:hypothetical protein|nr:hypothetical protein [Candidatus Auribacterota bacterium]
MKPMLFIATMCFIVAFTCVHSYSAVTTSDGVITLDFYEDTTFNGRWIFDIILNDVEGVESVYFNMELHNTAVTYDNEYNYAITELHISAIPAGSPTNPFVIPYLDSLYPTAVGTEYSIYGMPAYLLFPLSEPYGTPIIDEFEVLISYATAIDQSKTETLTLTGPVAFVPVPEPMSMVLFVFGALFLKRCIRK